MKAPDRTVQLPFTAVQIPVKALWQNGILLASLSGASILIAALYVSSESFFYYWDFGGYQGEAIARAIEFLESPIYVLRRIHGSINQEYNFIYTIPLIPLILVFGASRLGFVLAVTLSYMIPYALSLGAVAALLVRKGRLLAFWSGAFLTILIPAAWAPTLRGYPDVGSALLLTLALLVYLHDPRLLKPLQIAGAGFLLAAAMLFRRHFAFGVAALFGAMVIQAGIDFVKRTSQDKAAALPEFFWRCIRIGFAGVVMVVFLALMGMPFIQRLFEYDYLALYHSYMLSPGEIARFFWRQFGLFYWVMAIMGLVFAARKKLLHSQKALFFITYWTLAKTNV